MIISIEGLPGCYQNEIYQRLQQEYKLTVKECHPRGESLELFWSNTKKHGLSYHLDWLSRLSVQYKEPGELYDSIYAFREAYPKFFLHKEWIELDTYEQDILQRYYDLHYQPPDVILYLYGNFNRCYERTANDSNRYTYENFKELHWQYEWTFDSTNCKIPIFKINIDDDLDNIVGNIITILKKISPNLINPPATIEKN